VSTPTLARTAFTVSRASEYFDVRELQASTGVAASRFADAVVKELLDNSADACEMASTNEITIGWSESDGLAFVTVSDNGGGISPAVVARVLDFTTRTSDKQAYRTPTRGQQGNALKTVIGIPFALGIRESVVIESQGVRHTIRPQANLVGDITIDHAQESSGLMVGTKVTVPLPVTGISDVVFSWADRFALVNPHLTLHVSAPGVHAESADPEIFTFYKKAGDDFNKPMPTDLPSPHWHTPDSFRKLLGLVAEQGGNVTINEFLRTGFRGLSSPLKAKAVCQLIPAKRVREVAESDDLPGALLAAMQRESRPPKADILGAVGEDNLIARLGEPGRHWYAKQTGVHAGIPFMAECLIVEHEDAGEDEDAFYSALNYSPTFSDPFARAALSTDKAQGYGVRGLLRDLKAFGYGGKSVTVALHVVSPVFDFLDRGKTHLAASAALADIVAATVAKAAKQRSKEGHHRGRDAVVAQRAEERDSRERKPSSISAKSAVFTVMTAAYEAASGGQSLPVSLRTLYYAVRPRIQALTDAPLSYSNFDKIMTLYELANGMPQGFYKEARGVLVEPHTGTEVPLGTREVANYDIPFALYDKILFIEKQGLQPVIAASGIAEKYDLAMVYSNGQPSSAARNLLARLQAGRDYKVFVLHDADPAGRTIARAVGEETARMPDHHIDVIDIGLSIQEALDMGLQTEEFERKQALASTVDWTDLELEYFGGRRVGEKKYIAQRVELNAMSSPNLIAFIEAALEKNGATGKVIPSGDYLARSARASLLNAVSNRVESLIDRVVSEIIDRDAITDGLVESIGSTIDFTDAGVWVKEAFERDRLQRWTTVVDRRLLTEVAAVEEDIEQAIREAFVEGMNTEVEQVKSNSKEVESDD